MTSINFASNTKDFTAVTTDAHTEEVFTPEDLAEYNKAQDLLFITKEYPDLLNIPTVQFNPDFQEVLAIKRSRKLFSYEVCQLQRSCNSHELIVSNWIIERLLGDFVYVSINSRTYLNTYLVRDNGLCEIVTVYENDGAKFATMLNDIQSKIVALQEVHDTHMLSAAEFETMIAGHVSNSRSFAAVDMIDISQDELLKADALSIDAAKHKLFAEKALSHLSALKSELESLTNL